MKTANEKIRVSSAQFYGREREYVLDCLDTLELSGGGMSKYGQRLEAAWAEFCGVSYAVSCSSGTAALHLALAALGLRPGQGVLVPAITYVATANAVSYLGGVPIVCEVRPDTWTLDPADAERLILEAKRGGRDVAGMIPVHLYGVVADMTALTALARKHDLWVLEDAAEAHGAIYAGRRAGALGDIAAFSFYGNKTLTAGEGGIVTTNDPKLAESVRSLRGHAMSTSRQYWHDTVGYGYRMSNVSAAIALAQVETFSEHLHRRMGVMGAYLHALPSTFVLQSAPDGTSPWMCAGLLPQGVSPTRVAEQMSLGGIETRPVFFPLSDMPMYRSTAPHIAAVIAARGLCLPTHAGLTRDDVMRVVDSLKRSLM
jgi:perosamine synthetase